ncbi:uncharacterized protein LOC111486711 [Cucurbita maxima]|uniref:Uncharacterized protein LOC111486711 n=1 Tax=Cucurbita maxima TaxID=3661 RepID=A0A6J1JKX5_CUCMA|nr:uncharacterized protein LOC111486711 [Cucurbita maxima]
MLLIRVQDANPITDANFLFAEFINHEADLEFKPNSLTIIATNPTLRFIATLYISKSFCQDFTINQTHIARVSLTSFIDAIMTAAATRFDTLAITLPSAYIMILTFETSTPSGRVPQSHPRALPMSPSLMVDFPKPILAKHFTIKAECFRRVLAELPLLQDLVSVTPTGSEVKFSNEFKEIILSQEAGECTIMGYEGCVDTQFKVVLNPRMFFLGLSSKTSTSIWFYRTMSAGSIMAVPTCRSYAMYYIHFPPI